VLFTGFPWNAIGYGMTPVPLMMQSAHIIGIMGITALSVFIFAAPALLGTKQGARIGVPLALLLFAAHLGYGAYVLYGTPKPPATASDKSPVIRLVQPMIDQSSKMDSDADRAAIFEKHLKLSAEAPKDGGRKPDIIVWPETAIPFILTDNQDALTRIADTLDDNQVLIAGAVAPRTWVPAIRRATTIRSTSSTVEARSSRHRTRCISCPSANTCRSRAFSTSSASRMSSRCRAGFRQPRPASC
jgi:apolipoprotein N-acyltransferase